MLTELWESDAFTERKDALLDTLESDYPWSKGDVLRFRRAVATIGTGCCGCRWRSAMRACAVRFCCSSWLIEGAGGGGPLSAAC